MSEEEKPYISDNPEDIKQAKANAKVREKNRRDKTIALMQNPDFREFAWELLESAHIFKTSFTGNDSETNYREGERNVGLKVFTRLMGDAPDLYATMAKENSHT